MVNESVFKQSGLCLFLPTHWPGDTGDILAPRVARDQFRQGSRTLPCDNRWDLLRCGAVTQPAIACGQNALK